MLLKLINNTKTNTFHHRPSKISNIHRHPINKTPNNKIPKMFPIKNSNLQILPFGLNNNLINLKIRFFILLSINEKLDF